jgi:hypothetical protein
LWVLCSTRAFFSYLGTLRTSFLMSWNN